MIYHVTPYLTGDIGKGINETIDHFPDDSWICVRDIDTMFLLPEQPMWLEQVVEDTPYDVIGARCNRLGDTYQLWGEECSEDSDMNFHIFAAYMAYRSCRNRVEDVPDDKNLAGFFLLFRKSVWADVQFPERTIQFDLLWNKELKEKGYKRGLMPGMYLWHTYRLGAENPQESVDHLMNCHDFSLTKPKDYF